MVLNTDKHRWFRHGRGEFIPSFFHFFFLIWKLLIDRVLQRYKVEVKRPPQGMEMPPQNLAKKTAESMPSRELKFVCKCSAGLRIRMHPSLQSKQIGVVPVNETIVYCDEVSYYRYYHLLILYFGKNQIF